MSQSERQAVRRRALVLRVEAVLLYAGVPLFLAFALPPRMMFTVLGVMTLAGMVLLHVTPGFRWRDLLAGWRSVPWGLTVGVVVATAAVAGLATWLLFPDRLLALPLRAPGLWLTIMLAYPLVSALPQEILFRALFFRRYGVIFESERSAVAVNAVAFSFAHLMYGHWLVFAMTFAGGLVFAWVYAVRGNFPAAVLLHAVAGQIVFTSGLGVLFYSGAVG